jgi:hypothetical protein
MPEVEQPMFSLSAVLLCFAENKVVDKRLKRDCLCSWLTEVSKYRSNALLNSTQNYFNRSPMFLEISYNTLFQHPRFKEFQCHSHLISFITLFHHILITDCSKLRSTRWS